MSNIPDIKRELNVALNMHTLETGLVVRQKDIHKLIEGRDTAYDQTTINNVASGRLNNSEIRKNMERIIWKYLPGKAIDKFIYYNPKK